MPSQSTITVAVAGGTGGVGQSLVKVLSALPRFEVLVLSRKNNIALPNQAKLVTVDYSSIASLTAMLESNKVTSVVSALYDEAGAEQLNLIAAADASCCTVRFIASDWGVTFPSESVELFPFVAWRFQAIEALKKTKLEWTRVHPGYFMDYYGRSSNVTGSPFVIDVPGNAAAIPGSGNEPLAMTHTYDVGRFVGALLSLESGQWEESTYLYGERVTWNEVLTLVEKARAKPLKVCYDSVENLQKLQITPLPGHDVAQGKEEMLKMYAMFGVYVVHGLFDVPPEKSLNVRFPEIKPIGIKEFLQMSWEKQDAQSISPERYEAYCSPKE